MPAAPERGSAVTYQVGELVETLRGILESALPRVWVQGEVSNFSRPASGHWYFTLKDAKAQLRCVMFRGQNFHVRPQPRDGDAVIVRGQVGVYTARGELQLVCEHLEAAGDGALLRAFEQLKARLAAEGLFDETLKRRPPALPRAIGIITSATGAAVQDILTTLARRFPLAPVYLHPVPVQGAEAAPAIVRALGELPKRVRVDVILLARGGGSLEDLWAFNEEVVARAIRGCPVPVVTGIGHEVDFTIADFAADLRAPTPTAAAELVTPNRADLLGAVRAQGEALEDALVQRLDAASDALTRCEQRLGLLHPGRRLREQSQRVDELAQRLEQAQLGGERAQTSRLAHLVSRLSAVNPARSIALQRRHVDGLALQARAALGQALQAALTRLARAEPLLQSLNPRAVLERGYAIALTADGRALTDAAQAQPGDALHLMLARGELDAIVADTKESR